MSHTAYNYKAYYIEEANGKFYVGNNLFATLKDARSHVDQLVALSDQFTLSFTDTHAILEALALAAENELVSIQDQIESNQKHDVYIQVRDRILKQMESL